MQPGTSVVEAVAWLTMLFVDNAPGVNSLLCVEKSFEIEECCLGLVSDAELRRNCLCFGVFEDTEGESVGGGHGT
jgi:hypothetical protein